MRVEVNAVVITSEGQEGDAGTPHLFWMGSSDGKSGRGRGSDIPVVEA